jgi:hypothetical protein
MTDPQVPLYTRVPRYWCNTCSFWSGEVHIIHHEDMRRFVYCESCKKFSNETEIAEWFTTYYVFLYT